MKTRSILGAIAVSVTTLLGGHAMAADQPSVVLVHGAYADGSDWSKVIPLLRAKGIQVTAVQNSLESLAGDVAATRRAIDNQKGKVILVGHSWGGTVITEAGQNDKVAALVYVAAYAPDVGQGTRELSKDYAPTPGVQKLVKDSQGFLTLPPAALAEDFAQDVPADEAAVMAVTQGPLQVKALSEKVTVAAWKTRPSYYIVSANDRIIPPDLERAMARKIGAKVTTLPTSHVPHRSRPADVAAVIVEAVNANTNTN
jgi:pimeloyl-ACP methyl ester carboxylesterase